MNGLEQLREIYNIARNIDDGTSLNLIRAAQSEEERDFFAYIHNMNLRRAQKAFMARESEMYAEN